MVRAAGKPTSPVSAVVGTKEDQRSGNRHSVSKGCHSSSAPGTELSGDQQFSGLAHEIEFKYFTKMDSFRSQ